MSYVDLEESTIDLDLCCETDLELYMALVEGGVVCGVQTVIGSSTDPGHGEPGGS